MINLNQNLDLVFPRSHPCVFFHAHPDDESFLSAGLIAELAKSGRECVIVFAAAATVPGQAQTYIRQREAQASAQKLGVSTVLYLGFSEPKYLLCGGSPLERQDPVEVSRQLAATLMQHGGLTPGALISYDKNGGYGNVDHKILHAAGRTFKEMHSSSNLKLFEVTINRDLAAMWIADAQIRLNSDSIPKLSYWEESFGLPEEEISHCFTLSNAQLRLKRNALAAHESQMHAGEFPLCLSESDFANFFGKEWLLEVPDVPQPSNSSSRNE